jgi:hypothetical protein
MDLLPAVGEINDRSGIVGDRSDDSAVSSFLRGRSLEVGEGDGPLRGVEAGTLTGLDPRGGKEITVRLEVQRGNDRVGRKRCTTSAHPTVALKIRLEIGVGRGTVFHGKAETAAEARRPSTRCAPDSP